MLILISLAATLRAGPAPAPELTSPHWWLRAAAEHAASIEPQADADAFPSERYRTHILTNILLTSQPGDQPRDWV